MFIDTSLRPQGEKQQVGKLKLSEAIRIGAKIRPQAFGLAFTDGKSCAWGAAWEGSGNPYDEHKSYATIFTFRDDWGDANNLMIRERGVGIALANDSGQSRESIADWLESQGL